MGLPATIDGRTVIVGGGLHAAVIAATMNACGKPRPVVVEKRPRTGGIFGDLSNFRMNSASGASVASVAAGPTRVPSVSRSDNLNWIPNADRQVDGMSGMSEYPYSYDMAKLIRETLDAYAEVYTDSEIVFDGNAFCFSVNDGTILLGQARTIVFAGGLVEPPGLPKGPAIMSGYAFMKKPVRDLAGKNVAIVGGGDTACQCAEFCLGQGVSKPTSWAASIDWYGTERMPTTKEKWMSEIHARWAGIGRALPQGSAGGGPIKPYALRGEVASLGNAAWVNGRVYDLVIMATGFATAKCPVTFDSELRVGGKIVARYYNGDYRIFRVGTAAALNVSYKPFRSRFPAAMEAFYNLGPRTAAFAASEYL